MRRIVLAAVLIAAVTAGCGPSAPPSPTAPRSLPSGRFPPGMAPTHKAGQ
jgi:nitrous oxide reductase accessory protein NosL